MTLIADPKEVKRQRDRERYAQNKDEINKRRREAYKQKKIASAEISGAQTQLGVSQGNKDELHSSLYILLYINDLFFIYSGSNEINKDELHSPHNIFVYTMIYSSSTQAVMRLRIVWKGSGMHEIGRKY